MFFSPFMSLINREKLCVNREKLAPKNPPYFFTVSFSPFTSSGTEPLFFCELRIDLQIAGSTRFALTAFTLLRESEKLQIYFRNCLELTRNYNCIRANQKNPRAHKNKIGTPPPKSQNPPPPPKRRNFMDKMVFPAERTHFSRRP